MNSASPASIARPAPRRRWSPDRSAWDAPSSVIAGVAPALTLSPRPEHVCPDPTRPATVRPTIHLALRCDVYLEITGWATRADAEPVLAQVLESARKRDPRISEHRIAQHDQIDSIGVHLLIAGVSFGQADAIAGEIARAFDDALGESANAEDMAQSIWPA
ncbi:hypothetical protein Bequi_09880 [Brachybacterium sp. JHP9]|uniref:DUF503 domain-containing protein n=1 Tax=Brachybacterium equifaecis TaxID=2910770 RepID=A0ABT0R197_9MICO|nr:hypothetical protein [Brachybacterium equifaecis]MCL6423692.1 hypothetical protein [Brachybacterium equifaecis]